MRSHWGGGEAVRVLSVDPYAGAQGRVALDVEFLLQPQRRLDAKVETALGALCDVFGAGPECAAESEAWVQTCYGKTAPLDGANWSALAQGPTGPELSAAYGFDPDAELGADKCHSDSDCPPSGLCTVVCRFVPQEQAKDCVCASEEPEVLTSAELAAALGGAAAENPEDESLEITVTVVTDTKLDEQGAALQTTFAQRSATRAGARPVGTTRKPWWQYLHIIILTSPLLALALCGGLTVLRRRCQAAAHRPPASRPAAPAMPAETQAKPGEDADERSTCTPSDIGSLGSLEAPRVRETWALAEAPAAIDV